MSQAGAVFFGLAAIVVLAVLWVQGEHSSNGGQNHLAGGKQAPRLFATVLCEIQ
jgi:hypothetical protein